MAEKLNLAGQDLDKQAEKAEELDTKEKSLDSSPTGRDVESVEEIIKRGQDSTLAILKSQGLAGKSMEDWFENGW